MERRQLTDEELVSLESRARAVGELQLAVLGPLLLELVLGYRERVIDVGELTPAGGDAFLGAMMGGFAGGMLERKLRELTTPRELCAATRAGRRCTLRSGHREPKHNWGPLPPGKKKK
jgi:hypothetical protein